MHYTIDSSIHREAEEESSEEDDDEEEDEVEVTFGVSSLPA